MEKAVIVAVFDLRQKEHEIKAVLEELKLLTESAGGEVAVFFYQKRRSPDKKYHIGKGKANEIKNAAYAGGVEVVVFYNRLSNNRQRNLERFFKLKVVDRTGLILDIFAGRARTLEGKLQVELALLLYHLPRLTGKGTQLSRLGGGIGTRGPGKSGGGEAYISAKENRGIPALKKAIFEKYFKDYQSYKLEFPRGALNVESIKRWAIVYKQNTEGSMMELEILCLKEKMIQFKGKYGGYLR